MSKAFFSVCILLGVYHVAMACTVVAVGKTASRDGSVMVAHSQDDVGDPRLCRIPAMDHAPGSMRPVYHLNEQWYPRYVSSERGECYLPQGGQSVTAPLGHVPQVSHTYSYFESTYGMLNEHGVGLAESSCSGIFEAKPLGLGGRALLSIASLSRLALERTRTAREAVELMGAAAEEYGFYGFGTFGASQVNGEALMVGDPQEAYIFHVLPDPTGTSAIWAAQRVPDEQVAVVANSFVIRSINFADPANFLFSDSVRAVAEERGWWRAGEAFDFTKLYSAGEYGPAGAFEAKYYSGRRLWGAFRLVGVELNPFYHDLRLDAPYPVTATPNGTVALSDLFRIYRDYYEGTQFDLSKGLAAGPWGDPDRWFFNEQMVEGGWERSISQFRTSYSFVIQLRSASQSYGSVLWWGPHVASGTVYFPVPSIATTVPEPYAVANPFALDRRSMFWAHRYAWNVAKIKYDHAMPVIRSTQASLEAAGAELLAALDVHVSGGAPALASSHANEQLALHAAQVLGRCWGLADVIVAKFADGWSIHGDNNATAVGYPNWWLEEVGFTRGRQDTPGPPRREPELCVRSCPAGPEFAPCASRCLPNPAIWKADMPATQTTSQTGFAATTVLACICLSSMVTAWLLGLRTRSAPGSADAARERLLA